MVWKKNTQGAIEKIEKEGNPEVPKKEWLSPEQTKEVFFGDDLPMPKFKIIKKGKDI